MDSAASLLAIEWRGDPAQADGPGSSASAVSSSAAADAGAVGEPTARTGNAGRRARVSLMGGAVTDPAMQILPIAFGSIHSGDPIMSPDVFFWVGLVPLGDGAFRPNPGDDQAFGGASLRRHCDVDPQGIAARQGHLELVRPLHQQLRGLLLLLFELRLERRDAATTAVDRHDVVAWQYDPELSDLFHAWMAPSAKMSMICAVMPSRRSSSTPRGCPFFRGIETVNSPPFKSPGMSAMS
eukprot:CAMPEP_0117504128 /NCGR_PEP_ID=MMETSP0784-20121206/24688_1 /TAXON_ID=39447 /ORGANISM="" /LENGTH=238 /DNA_ID=CAMNT_0005299471 /DNA_START=117 /DNA_END=833 /DNA_ORIENTATION=-